MKVDRLERGWPGHFIGADRCIFRRNTLLTCGDIRVIVSSIGDMIDPITNEIVMIGHNRYYETVVFNAHWTGKYWDIDVNVQLYFDSPWSVDDPEGDDIANDYHEGVVSEMTQKLLNGEINL